jgi:hypothetical protein
MRTANRRFRFGSLPLKAVEELLAGVRLSRISPLDQELQKQAKRAAEPLLGLCEARDFESLSANVILLLAVQKTGKDLLTESFPRSSRDRLPKKLFTAASLIESMNAHRLVGPLQGGHRLPADLRRYAHALEETLTGLEVTLGRRGLRRRLLEAEARFVDEVSAHTSKREALRLVSEWLFVTALLVGFTEGTAERRYGSADTLRQRIRTIKSRTLLDR